MNIHKLTVKLSVEFDDDTKEQIRQIVREEIAAQKERLFAEAKEYNTRTTLAAIEAYEKSCAHIEPLRTSDNRHQQA